LTQYFAVKELGCTKDIFKQEVRVLKRLPRAHDHLISLQATYHFEEHYNLVFPWGDCNLREYWMKENPDPSHDDATVSWLVRQCEGIAEALSLVHHHWTASRSSILGTPDSPTRPKRPIQGRPPQALKRSSLSSVPIVRRSVDSGPKMGHKRPASLGQVPTLKQEVVSGAHMDIKPENLLWFPNHKDLGTIKISDFGSSQFKPASQASMSRTSYSPPYRPPESALPFYDTTSPSSGDIWSLGCVFLEFATWYIGGSGLLKTLDDLKAETSQKQKDASHSFFEMVDPADEAPEEIADIIAATGGPTPIVKPDIKKVCITLSPTPARWQSLVSPALTPLLEKFMDYLHRKQECCSMLGKFLDKIEGRMLIVEPKTGTGQVRRISSGNLFRDLGEMIEAQKFEKASRFLSMKSRAALGQAIDGKGSNLGLGIPRAGTQI